MRDGPVLPGDAGGGPPADGAGCARMFAEFAATAATRAPFYARLAAAIARDPAVAGWLLAAPATQRQPVLLLACVHAILLEDPTDDLARWYPNLCPAPERSDPLDAFRACCDRHAPRLAEMLATRHTQTNEIGRCAVLVPPFGLIAAEVGPLAHVDVGASAGLNLLLGRYHYRYEPGGDVGPASPVTLTCGVRGPVPIPPEVPAVRTAVGLDPAPIDVRSREQARWLEACVWPDQTDRFHRLQAALALAREVGVDVRVGTADDAPGLAAELAAAGHHPVLTNTWVLNYLTRAERERYLAGLDDVGARVDLSWVYAESPLLVAGVPTPPAPPRPDRTVVTIVRWRRGRRHVDHVAECHPHGYWLHWHAASA